jgi:hypothetical protein
VRKRIDRPGDRVFLQPRTHVEQSVDVDLQKVVKFNRGLSFEPLDRNAVYRSVSPDTPICDVKNTKPALYCLKFFALLDEAVTREALSDRRRPARPV